MQKLEQKRLRLKKKCMNWRLDFYDKFKISDVIQDNAPLNEVVCKIQGFLNDACNDLVYGNNNYSISYLSKEINSNFIVKSGLISLLDVDKYWNENNGLLRYFFYLGEDSQWDERLSVISISESWSGPKTWSEIKAKLFNGDYMVGGRFLTGGNTTSVLLANSRRKSILGEGPTSLIGYSSEDGLTKTVTNTLTELKWTLVNPEDFPQIYAMISRDEHPLGFLQLMLSVPEDDAFKLELHEDKTDDTIHVPFQPNWDS